MGLPHLGRCEPVPEFLDSLSCVALTAFEGNRIPGFHRSKLLVLTERASFGTAENTKAQTVLSLPAS